MQTPRESSENRVMHGIAVALLSEDQDHLSALQNRVEATRLGQPVFSHVGFPAGPTDAILRQLQDSRAEVVVVDIPAPDPQRAIRTIELIRATTQQIAVFANGAMTHPASIVASMRAGAGEYLDHSAGFEPLLEALTRFSSSRTRSGVGEWTSERHGAQACRWRTSRSGRRAKRWRLRHQRNGDGLFRRQHRHRDVELRPELRDERQ